MKHFKERITQKLKQSNFTVASIERNAGLGVSVLRNLLRGKSHNPRIETVIALAKALNCTVDDLLAETDTSEKAFILPSFIEKNSFEEKINYSLLGKCVSLIESITSDKTPLNYLDFLKLLSEVYFFSLGKKEEIPDRAFALWALEKKK